VFELCIFLDKITKNDAPITEIIIVTNLETLPKKGLFIF
jgi:hypothetical protein